MTTDDVLQRIVSRGWIPDLRHDGLGRWVAEATRWEEHGAATQWAHGETPSEAVRALEQRLPERLEVSA